MSRNLFALVAIMLFAPMALAQEQVGGFLHRFGTDLLMTPNSNPGRYYRLVATHDDTQNTLNRLEDGDFVMASGVVSADTGTVSVDSIDFVGLRRIIGLWNALNSKGLVNFRNYQEMNMYSLAGPNEGTNVSSTRKHFRYTVTPGSDRQWVMFMSDEKETQMGFLQIGDDQATLKLVNSQTGDVSSTLELRKLAQ